MRRTLDAASDIVQGHVFKTQEGEEAVIPVRGFSVLQEVIGAELDFVEPLVRLLPLTSLKG